MRANKGTISVGTGSKISRLFDNTGTIFVSSGGQVENIRGNCKEIHFGPNCTVELIEGNTGTIIFGEGGIVRNVSSNSGTVFIEGHVVHGKNCEAVKSPPPTSVASIPSPSLATNKKELYLRPTLTTLTKPVTRDINKLKAAMLTTLPLEEKFPSTASKLGMTPSTPGPQEDKASFLKKNNLPSSKNIFTCTSQTDGEKLLVNKFGGIDLSAEHNPSAPPEDQIYDKFQDSSRMTFYFAPFAWSTQKIWPSSVDTFAVRIALLDC
ncbi:uncharacterized protein LOC110854909 [Folsomia candida]|uniref:Uncharacterized protein n=1 Tax=Folsomia candida TaxID=158441 RepID=A0A226DUA8_FOLCA|nr:uncharacterized protein LOC110854909 [Folsomia candida]OXA48823.1 hypothetical protein Fcan01_16796 [Folsomia candida]